MKPSRTTLYIALLLAALAGCGAWHPQTDSNSNWLRGCRATDDCASGQLCACGVCTIACVADDGCQSLGAPDARCVSVTSAQCVGPSKGAVCAASCARDADCGGKLSCVEHGCVLTRSVGSSHEADAAVASDATIALDAEVSSDAALASDAAVDLDAAVDIDAAPDGGSTQPSVPDTGAVAPPPIEPTCEERLGCAQGFACLGEHCQRLWSGNGCEPATETRQACNADVDCGQGHVCHVDGTCIAPGQCDRFGLTTYASVGAIVEMVLTKDSVFLLDYGTEDALGNHKVDGAIVRVALADGSVQSIVSGLERPTSMLVDAARVHWASESAPNPAQSADRIDGAHRISVTDHFYRWVQDAGYLYVESWTGSETGLYRTAKGSAVDPLKDRIASQSNAPALAVDSQYVYWPGAGGLDRIPVAGGPVSTLAGVTIGDPVVAGGDRLFFTEPPAVNIFSVTKDGVTRKALARKSGGVALMLAYRDHIYFAAGELADERYSRAPIVPGETEDLAAVPTQPTSVVSRAPFAVGDLGLFYMNEHRLVRQVIEDYASGPTPAQGAAGGPCFGDLGCDDGLACIDTSCK